MAQVSATQSSELRGEQLLRQVQQVIAITGAEKELIGHLPTVAPPFAGCGLGRPPSWSPPPPAWAGQPGLWIGTWCAKVAPGSAAETLAVAAASALSGGHLLLRRRRPPPDPRPLDASLPASAPSASTSYPEASQPALWRRPMLAANGVYYFSWSGRGNMTNILDPVDPALALGPAPSANPMTAWSGSAAVTSAR